MGNKNNRGTKNPSPAQLVVDLDHSLIKADMMVLSIKWLIKHKFWLVPLLPFWLLKGRANLKYKLYEWVQLNTTKLPYNQAVIDYIKQRRERGDTIILATASHPAYARGVADYLGIFHKAYGSSQTYNLSAKNKAKFLVEKYGYYEFDYIGDHKRDIPVWQVANLAIIVRPKNKLKRQTQYLYRYLID